VPAFMSMLGQYNWWAPKPLAAFHERFGLVEEPQAALASDCLRA
jgi:putative drug exporter of the RND superfamily